MDVPFLLQKHGTAFITVYSSQPDKPTKEKIRTTA